MEPGGDVLAFGPFTFDVREGVLSKGDDRISLTPKQAQLLTLLVLLAGFAWNRRRSAARLAAA